MSYCLTNAFNSYSSESYYTNMSDLHNLYTNNKNQSKHSPIIGWLLDGYPVYGPIGYKYTYTNKKVESTLDSSGNYITVFKKSSYTYQNVNTSFSETVNNQLSYYNGYKYDSALADQDEDGVFLDHCNGIFGPTPEFPDGIYHYHMTLKIDDEGNATKALDYFYPYDIDSMILTNDNSLVSHINNELDTTSQEVLDDIADTGDMGDDSVQIQIVYGDLWSECLLKIYTREETSGTYAYESSVYDSKGTLYDNFDDWESDNNQGGVLNFWLRDTNNLGYSKLKQEFPSIFDQFETIVPAFPYITNILRGDVKQNSDSPMSNGNELSFLTSNNTNESYAWINAWTNLEDSKKQF